VQRKATPSRRPSRSRFSDYLPASAIAQFPMDFVHDPRRLPADVSLSPVTDGHFAELREVAGVIWRQHYTGIISAAQIDFMLASRFTDEALDEQLRATDRWLHLLRVSDTPVGYCSYELASIDSGQHEPAAMKLGQFYVLESHRGTGLGRFMLRHVETHSSALGRQLLWLQVNKQNAPAIRFYKKTGFQVVREAVFDIGEGFVMDDYLMAKRIAWQ